MIASAAYAAAFASSASFGLATVLEQVGTKRVKVIDSANPLNFIPLLKQVPYLAGLALDGVGFAAFLLAAHALPLFFVQAVGTASIAVTALAARYILKVRLTLNEYRLMAILILGLGILAYSAAPELATPVSNGFRGGTALVCLIVAAACLASSKQFKERPLFGAFLSGLCFSGLAVASRILPFNVHSWGLSGLALAFALALSGMAGMMLFSMALQAGSATRVYAVNFVTETLVPTVIGLWFLGDLPRNHMWLVMILGLVVTVLSTTALALAKDYSHA